MSIIDHVAFKVESISDAVEWYVKKVGAEIQYQDATWAMLLIGDIKLALVLPEAHPNHFAIRCNSLEEFPIPPEQVGSHRDGSQYVYLTDPYGNAIEWIHYPKNKND